MGLQPVPQVKGALLAAGRHSVRRRAADAGLIVQDIFNIIKEINKQGVTILLIEQNANMALRIADQGYVLETGRISLSGTGRELLADESVKAAYLGKKKK